MSTNFYFRDVKAETYDDVHHIGLSSARLFVFQAFPRKGLTTLEAWKKYLQVPGRVIVDEYIRIHSVEDFTRLVESSKNAATCREYSNSPQLPATEKITSQIRRYRDEHGHMFGNYNFS